MLQPCVTDGYFREEDIPDLIESATIIHDGLLWRVLNHEKNRDIMDEPEKAKKPSEGAEEKKINPKECTRLFLKFFLQYVQDKLCREKALPDIDALVTT